MAAKGDTEIKMDFTFGNASAARNIVKDIYRHQVADMKAMNQQANILGANMRKVGRSVMMGVAGFAGVAGVNTIFNSLSQGAAQFISKRSDLEKAITPLSSLGDNVGKMADLRREVTGTSIALGRSKEDIAGFLFDLQSTTGNLSITMRETLKKETLELAEVTGGDLVTAQNLLTKSFQIYGSEVENVNQLQNKLMKTQEQAAVRFEDLATRAPELMGAGQVVGLSLDEVLGSIIGATKKSGSIEKTFTGMRNVFLLMETAQKKGVTLTGTYLDKLSQLKEQFTTNGAKMRSLFGQEAVVHAKVLADSVDDVAASMKTLGAITGDTDMVMEKLQTRLKDPGHLFVREMEAIKATIDNAPNLAPDSADDSFLVRMQRKAQYGVANAQVANGGQLGSLGSFLGGARGLVIPGYAEEGREIVASQTDGELFRALMRKRFEEKKSAELLKEDRGIAFLRWMGYTEDGIQPFVEKRNEIANRQPSPHLMTAEELRQSRGEPSTVATANNDAKETNRLLGQLINVTAQSVQSRNPAPMPGGSRANATEAL